MFSFNIRVGFSDCDYAGVIYFAKIFDLAHSVYEEFLHTEAIYKEYFVNRKIVYPIIHADVSFLSPIKLGDKIAVHLTLKSIRNSSFELEFEFSNEENDLKAIVTTIHCAVDTAHNSKTEIPEMLRETLLKLK